ncbi:hypothetical protein EXIGLDRAFT_830282 [Exidia glandulosa HHB12029]|uniref:Phytanoyl-CoA dioxygenase n=1 Tax=Exidia glandulosa HHB12029 TaxID=1314781 RepID=A0A165NQW8_EXIGL|nr:hypothetical protein EXIGLDRAFT_830282 [Exidia glandulosa HHB12029]
MSAVPSDRVLTPEQIAHFIEFGYVKIPQAFSAEKAQTWMQGMWERLGFDPLDKSTWTVERTHMPDHKRERVEEFAPKAWKAICELLGGEDRIDPESATWNDQFIVNLGSHEWEGPDKRIEPQNLDNWHLDGDFFVHFLDSPEQALLVIPIFSEIQPRGGGTFICPDGLVLNAQYLSQHPEGVLPTGLSFTPSTEEHNPSAQRWEHLVEVKRCKHFVEVTGSPGDVYLLHPLMLHSASKNHLRIPRIITNPPVALKQPFCFDREDEREYSIVERTTLRALGVERFPFDITGERRRIVPERVKRQERMREEELKRLETLAVPVASAA